MFLRMVTASLLRRPSRMLIALLSIGIGATILVGLLTIYYDVPRQMGAQLRSYGANMILLPDEGTEMTPDTLRQALSVIPQEQLFGATPYRYVRLDMAARQQSFTSAGTETSFNCMFCDFAYAISVSIAALKSPSPKGGKKV